MKMKKLAVFLAVSALGAGTAAGCAGETDEQKKASAEQSALREEESVETTAAEILEEENYNTGDASLDNTRNQDGIGEKELLVVSFGTSYNDSRRLTIGAIEDSMEETFPDYSVRRGFTSQIIIDHIKSRDQAEIDNVTEALNRAADNGVKRLVIQPTHLMNGLEYTDLVSEAAEFSDSFEQIAVGAPLLTSDEDFKAVIKAITEDTAEYDDGDTAICFMGHGTEAESNQVYFRLQEMLAEEGYGNYFIGTVEAEPSLENVLEAVKAGQYKKVVLQPLMVVAGDHANNDMAGEGEDTWRAAFEEAGYDVTCVVKGLGELEPIRQLFADHAREAMDSLEV